MKPSFGARLGALLRMSVPAAALLFAVSANAAAPASGTLNPGDTTSITFNGTAPGGTSPEGEITCVEGVNCDTFTLTLGGTPADWSGKVAKVKLDWLTVASDYDMFIHQGSITGPEVARAAEGVTISETAILDPATTGTGVFAVRVVYFAATAADQYRGSAGVEEQVVVGPVVPRPSSATPPTYSNFFPPAPLGARAGEPTLGNNFATGRTMFIAALQTLRVTWDDSVSPATATWENKSAVNTSITSFDPLLFTDPKTNRTFVSQLLPSKVSLMSYSDNDGETWLPSQGAGINSGVDHQTIGGGPFKPGVVGRGPITSYPNAVYYASQDIGLAEIALSRDGGITFDVAVPMYNITECGGLHGHIKVAPDGTVYVPNKNCGGSQAVLVSEDNGFTWNIRTVPGSTNGRTDPSVGIGSDGTIYVAYANGDGRPRVAVSRDRGLTFADDQEVGSQFGIQNSVFPAATAGDGDRAAFFFLGTATAGSAATGTDLTFDGIWHGYIATTYDRGFSWVTVQATVDPIQRGVVCTNGTTCPSGTRNLLDFNDLEVDRNGRAVAAAADGCITAECINGVDRKGPAGVPDGKVDSYDGDGSRRALILRQSSGKALFSSFDVPDAPSGVTAVAVGRGNEFSVTVSWTDNSNNETEFIVERATSATGAFSRIGVTAANATSFTDNSVTKRKTYYYRVRANSANGQSANSNVASVYVK